MPPPSRGVVVPPPSWAVRGGEKQCEQQSYSSAAGGEEQCDIKFLLCGWRLGKCGFRNSVKKNRPNVVFNTKSFYFSDLQKGSPERRFQYKKFLFFRPSERFSQNVVFNTNSFYFSDLQKGSPERRFQYK